MYICIYTLHIIFPSTRITINRPRKTLSGKCIYIQRLYSDKTSYLVHFFCTRKYCRRDRYTNTMCFAMWRKREIHIPSYIDI